MATNCNEVIGKREQILQAAIIIFASKGFFNAKVEEIAVEAKVGKGTVYEYFKSKQDLFEEMVKYIHNLYFETLMVDVSNRDTFREKMQYLLECHLKFVVENKEMARVLLSERPSLDEGFTKWVLNKEKSRLLFMQNHVKEAISRGEIRDIDPGLLSKVVTGVMTYIGNSMIVGDVELSNRELSDLSDNTINLLFTGIGR